MSITLQEIKNQYQALEKTISLICKRSEEMKGFFTQAAPRALLFTGCGSSYAVARSMRSVAAARFDLPVYALSSGDLWLNAESYRSMLQNTLVVSLSRSGYTSEVVNAYRAVRELAPDARFLTIACREGTPLEELSDKTLCIPWAFDESVCQTRCVSNLYAAGAMLLGELSGDDEVRAGFEVLTRSGNSYLERIEPELRDIAAKDWDHAIVLADGPCDGLAEEGALTFKEISQLPSNYYHLLDVRHGPAVLINRRTLVVARLHGGARPQETALVGELVQKGAFVLTSTNEPLALEGTVNFAFGQPLHEIAAGLPLLNLCQIVTFFKSGVVGCDPDAPDGLDPWIRL